MQQKPEIKEISITDKKQLIFKYNDNLGSGTMFCKKDFEKIRDFFMIHHSKPQIQCDLRDCFEDKAPNKCFCTEHLKELSMDFSNDNELKTADVTIKRLNSYLKLIEERNKKLYNHIEAFREILKHEL